MPGIGDLIIKIALDAGAMTGGVSAAKAQLQGLEAAVVKMGGTAANKFTDLLKDVGKAAISPLGLGAIGTIAGGSLFKNAIDEAREFAAAQKQLNATLQATGYAAGMTAEQIAALTEALARKTNFRDDDLIKAAATLATYRNISGGVFTDTLKTATDVAAVRGESLESVVHKLGRGLSSPEQGIGRALKSEGIFVSDATENRIKKLQEEGRLVEAQKILLDELNASYAGGAEAMASPTTQMKNAIAEAQKELGENFLPIINEIAKEVRAVAEAFADWERTTGSTGAVIGGVWKGLKLVGTDIAFVEYTAENLVSTLASVPRQLEYAARALLGLDTRGIQKLIGDEARRMQTKYEELEKWRSEVEEGPWWQGGGGDFNSRNMDPGPSEAARKAMEKETEELARLKKAFDATYDPTAAFHDKMADLIKLFHAGQIDLERFNAAADKLRETLDKQLAHPLADEIAKLKKEVDEFGLNEDARLLRKVRAEGTPEQIAEAEAEIQRRQRKKSEKEAEDSAAKTAAEERDRIDDISKRHQTPAERRQDLVQQMLELNQLMVAGLDPEKAAAEARQLAAKAAPETGARLGSPAWGSQEAARILSGAWRQDEGTARLGAILETLKKLAPDLANALAGKIFKPVPIAAP